MSTQPDAPAAPPVTTAGSRPAVALRGLVKTFGSGSAAVTAVDGVDLDIVDGEFLTLLGPSGSGKTTVLRMIAGFELPTAGSIRLGGLDVTRVPPFDRDVNTVFQDYALFPHMNVQQNVEYGLRVKGVARAERRTRAGEALEGVRLGAYGERKPAELSGGQRQRVALARALVNRPKVLLLDEPLGALDLKLREEMQVELKVIQRQVGITFVFVTHDQEEALTMSDRIAVFNAGRIEQVGLARPRSTSARAPSSSPASSARPTCSASPLRHRRSWAGTGAGRSGPEKIRLAAEGEPVGADEHAALGTVARGRVRRRGDPVPRGPRRRRPAHGAAAEPADLVHGRVSACAARASGWCGGGSTSSGSTELQDGRCGQRSSAPARR